jgi:PAS domain S-box-containing protein
MTTKKAETGRSAMFAQRIQTLYRRAQQPASAPTLSEAFTEMDALLEALRKTEDELRQQREQQLDGSIVLEAEFHYFRELFEAAPLGYLVTRLDGTIRKANAAAQQQFESEERLLMGRSLAQFLPEGQRRLFRAEIDRMRTQAEPQVQRARFLTGRGNTLDAILFCQVVRGKTGSPQELRWLVCDSGAVSALFEAGDYAAHEAADAPLDASKDERAQLVQIEKLALRIAALVQGARNGRTDARAEAPLAALEVGGHRRG